MQRNEQSQSDSSDDEKVSEDKRLFSDISHRNLNQIAKNYFLCIACYYGLTSTARYLLANGANAKAIISSSTGDIASTFEIAKICKESGIELDGGNIYYGTLNNKYPMQLALERKHIEIAELLAANGASIKAVFHSAHTLFAPPSLFSQALHAENNKALKFLVEHGVDVNVRDKNGLTALHVAAMKNNEEAVTILLQNGADPKAKTLNKKKTPKDLTTNNDIKKYLDFYISKDAGMKKGLGI